MFGNQLEKALQEVGIDTTGLLRDEEVHTTLAFVHTAQTETVTFLFIGIRERI